MRLKLKTYHFDRYNPTPVKYSDERELPIEHKEQSLFTHNMAFNRSIKKTLIKITIGANTRSIGILRVAIASLVRHIWYIYATNDSVFRWKRTHWTWRTELRTIWHSIDLLRRHWSTLQSSPIKGGLEYCEWQSLHLSGIYGIYMGPTIQYSDERESNSHKVKVRLYFKAKTIYTAIAIWIVNSYLYSQIINGMHLNSIVSLIRL